MKKITMIISTALLLTAVSGYATPTINKLVETKVEQAEVMLAPMPVIPAKVPGAVIKAVIEAFQQSAKAGDTFAKEISYEKLSKILIYLFLDVYLDMSGVTGSNPVAPTIFSA